MAISRDGISPHKIAYFMTDVQRRKGSGFLVSGFRKES
jgi:hypothetical protein